MRIFNYLKLVKRHTCKKLWTSTSPLPSNKHKLIQVKLFRTKASCCSMYGSPHTGLYYLASILDSLTWCIKLKKACNTHNALV